MRIGIIKLSALGDIVVAMSFLYALKEKYDCEIDWFVDERFEGILQNSPLVHTVYCIPLKRLFSQKDFKGIGRIKKKLNSLRAYDILFDMQGLLKSSILGKMIPAKIYKGFAWDSIKEPIASFFYNQRVKIPYQDNILKRNGALLGVEVFQPQKAFGFLPQSLQKVLPLFYGEKKKVLIVFEASKKEKMYPLAQWIEVCKAMKEEVEFLILFHSYPAEAQILAKEGRAKLLPLLSLDEVKALVSRVDGVVGGDTGIVHLAWAMQRPSITLYGNTPLKRFELCGEKNFSLSKNPNAQYKKNDFSIAKITPQEICYTMREMLK
ncbi:lipopolysaccharide heptosyltransferase I [Helicobacter cholecystus]|uniref:lipopolysaccharide heptosyltransferase I n=1 Tax=Helicobacter cholecystus TaxID=45498 RepID=UPI00273907A0|nr:lipopolysaccharide heptosyltransferase I [Helicobacter cholecystus]